MAIDIERIAHLRARYDQCFGCGEANPIGLHLDGFAIDGQAVTAVFEPRPEYAGFVDTLHGGIVATALDEASAWAAMITEGVLVYTAKLDIKYRRQANLGDVFQLTGTVVGRRGRRLTINAKSSGNGQTVAESEGLFVVAADIGSVL